jgi:enamine deaminase RidA (YjgF/YER057c/UK114 family)
MSERKKVFSGTSWEEFVGYSRAIRAGNVVEVSGTVAVDENGYVVGKNDAYEQTKYVIKKIEKAIVELGGSLKDVVKTRIYVSNINNWQQIGKAHGEFFKEIKPSSTLFEVSTLIGLDFLVEIEATAIIDES